MSKNLDAFSGFLDGDGTSPHGAHADHKHGDDYAAKNHNHDSAYEPKNTALLKCTKVTIAVDDWNEGSAEIDKPEGITTYVGYIFDLDSLSAATTAEITVSAVGTDTITFSADSAPSDPIDAYILYL